MSVGRAEFDFSTLTGLQQDLDINRFYQQHEETDYVQTQSRQSSQGNSESCDRYLACKSTL